MVRAFFFNEFNVDFYTYISYNTALFFEKNKGDRCAVLEYDIILKKFNELSKKKFEFPKEVSSQDFNAFGDKKLYKFDVLEAKEYYDNKIQNQIIINDWVFHSFVSARLGYYYYNFELKIY